MFGFLFCIVLQLRFADSKSGLRPFFRRGFIGQNRVNRPLNNNYQIKGLDAENLSRDSTAATKRRRRTGIPDVTQPMTNAMIAANYDVVTETLDLSGAWKDTSLKVVLSVMKSSVLFDQVEQLILRDNKFEGPLDSDPIRSIAFPPNLKALDMSNCELSGSFPWELLPPTLEILHLHNNRLENKIDWSLLPKELKTLWIWGNKFEGSVIWKDLPVHLSSLEVDNSMIEASDTEMLNHGWKKKKGIFSMFSKSDSNKVTFINQERSSKSLNQEKHPFDTYGVEQAASKSSLRKKANWALDSAKYMHLILPLIFIFGFVIRMRKNMMIQHAPDAIPAYWMTPAAKHPEPAPFIQFIDPF